ncbi:MAG TPA: PA2779 family protein [Acidobacteriaceae bacterium]|nr:PA2779 family protein [Acidobacteriaceae bacterium]
MKKMLSSRISILLVLLVGQGAASAPGLLAQNHVVSSSEIQKDLSTASSARQQNQEHVKSFLSSPEAQQAMKTAKINPQQVTNAVSQLSDADLARLAARTDKAQKDFAAGTIDNHDLLVILVAIAVLILIIVAVH